MMREEATIGSPAALRSPRGRVWLAAILLAALTVNLYWGAAFLPFSGYDDAAYIVENSTVRRGLTLDGVLWAFTTTHVANWHPLAWISHMIDVELFGLEPAAHHLVNVLLHTANTVLLFLVMRGMTGALLPCVFVAALFAIHPLHVESVAWIAERKDLLAGFFWLLTMVAYRRYLGKPSPVRYLALFVLFLLGLMAKPMGVTLPFALLLLDYWPLGRLGRGSAAAGAGARPIVEKIPLFALSAVMSLVTFLVQRAGGATLSLDEHALPVRLSNAVVSYAAYLGKTLWPSGLAVFYPLPGAGLAAWRIAASAAVLAALTGAVLASRRHPWLPVGWFWFLGTLVPVIGLVQAGGQGMADRYTYLPLVGLFLAVAWEGHELASRRPSARWALAAAGAAVVLLLSGVAGLQLSYWRTDEELFRHALDVTTENYVAHNALGAYLAGRGRTTEALPHWEEALRLYPRYPLTRFNLGFYHASIGQWEKAVEHYREALRQEPSMARAHFRLGLALEALGRIEEAQGEFREAFRLDPGLREARRPASRPRGPS